MPKKPSNGALHCGVCVMPKQDIALPSTSTRAQRGHTDRQTDIFIQAVNLDLGYKVVMRLMRNYRHRHHHVYADNFFTSVHLAEALLQAYTYLCGTTRATRKEFP